MMRIKRNPDPPVGNVRKPLLAPRAFRLGRPAWVLSLLHPGFRLRRPGSHRTPPQSPPPGFLRPDGRRRPARLGDLLRHDPLGRGDDLLGLADRPEAARQDGRDRGLHLCGRLAADGPDASRPGRVSLLPRRARGQRRRDRPGHSRRLRPGRGRRPALAAGFRLRDHVHGHDRRPPGRIRRRRRPPGRLANGLSPVGSGQRGSGPGPLFRPGAGPGRRRGRARRSPLRGGGIRVSA